MAKYVCDFDAVIEAGNKLVTEGGNLESAVTSYSSKISSDLSGWKGTAKSSFETVSTTKTADVKAFAADMKTIGEFIVSTAKAIQECDNQCAAQKI